MSDSPIEGTASSFSVMHLDCDDDLYMGSQDLICKVALPFSDPKFQLYHEIISLGEQIKILKAEKPVHFKKRVRTVCVSIHSISKE